MKVESRDRSTRSLPEKNAGLIKQAFSLSTPKDLARLRKLYSIQMAETFFV